MLNVRARRQLLFSKAGGRRSFRQLERLVRTHVIECSIKRNVEFVYVKLKNNFYACYAFVGVREYLVNNNTWLSTSLRQYLN
jgi:pectin methylesterase-like acyl-CoA thioesterase